MMWYSHENYPNKILKIDGAPYMRGNVSYSKCIIYNGEPEFLHAEPIRGAFLIVKTNELKDFALSTVDEKKQLFGYLS